MQHFPLRCLAEQLVNFARMIKSEDEGSLPEAFAFDFTGHNRRPPHDAVNARLSLAYSLLAKDLTIACYAVSLDPYMGFYHQPRFGRLALALDLAQRQYNVDRLAVNAAFHADDVGPLDPGCSVQMRSKDSPSATLTTSEAFGSVK